MMQAVVGNVQSGGGVKHRLLERIFRRSCFLAESTVEGENMRLRHWQYAGLGEGKHEGWGLAFEVFFLILI
jgi:hypothetical protein